MIKQSCIVWHTMLTEENKIDLERIQKCAVKIILKETHQNYQNSLNQLNLISLEERRENLCKKFAEKNVGNVKMKTLFEKNLKKHRMDTRNTEEIKVTFANTERMKNSPVIYMQKLLNQK